MPKQKTHRGTKKRFGLTGRGKVMRMKGNRGHNRSKKSKRQRYAIREMHEVAVPRLRKTIKALLPTGVGER